MHVFVTGATGFVGSHLVRALLRRGETVRALGRHPVRCGELARAGVEVVRGDLCDSSLVRRSCLGVDRVVHVAALSSPWGPARRFHATNVEGTRNVIAGCVAAGNVPLVHLSSPAVIFDGTDHRDADETYPFARRFNSHYGHTKKRAEDEVSRAISAGLPALILRPKAIFGPGDTSLLPRLINAARRGRLPQIGDGSNRVDLTYVENVVDAILLAMTPMSGWGRTFFITNDEHPQLWPVIREVLANLNVPPIRRTISLKTALLAARAMEAAATLTRREPPLTRYSASMLARTQTYNITAAKRDLGYAPAVSVANGLERTLAALRDDRA